MKRPVWGVVCFFAALMMCGGCDGMQKTKVMEIDNALTPEEIEAGILTPEVMWKMGRIGSSAISPDGGSVVYSLTHYNMQENKGVSSLWVVDYDGRQARRLTDGQGSDSAPAWNADGSVIYFLSEGDGDTQLWSVSPDGAGLRRISSVEGGIDGFGVAPAGGRVFYTKKVHVGNRTSPEIYGDMDKSKALVYDDLMARHWNYWDRGDYSHIFIARLENGQLSEGIDIMPGEAWDAPMAPYFDTGEIAWNNAGTQLAYTCKKLTGTAYAQSTDSDIYLYDVAAATTVNLTAGMPGYDKYPVFSPDDTKLAFRSMERPGRESDKEKALLTRSCHGRKELPDPRFRLQCFERGVGG